MEGDGQHSAEHDLELAVIHSGGYTCVVDKTERYWIRRMPKAAALSEVDPGCFLSACVLVTAIAFTCRSASVQVKPDMSYMLEHNSTHTLMAGKFSSNPMTFQELPSSCDASCQTVQVWLAHFATGYISEVGANLLQSVWAWKMSRRRHVSKKRIASHGLICTPEGRCTNCLRLACNLRWNWSTCLCELYRRIGR